MQKVFFIFLTALLLGSTASFASYTASNDDGAEHRSARQGVAETALMGECRRIKHTMRLRRAEAHRGK